MTKTNVKKAVAIGVLGLGLTSLVPLARDTVSGDPISVQPKTSIVSVDSTQSATNIKTVQKNIVTEKEKLINLKRKSEIAKVDELLRNAKPNDIAKLVKDIKTNGISDNFRHSRNIVYGGSIFVDSLLIAMLLKREKQRKKETNE